MTGVTCETLEEQGLVPLFLKAKSITADWYVDMENQVWQDDLGATLVHLAKNPDAANEFLIFRKCLSSERRGDENQFYHITEFPLKDGKWGSSVKEKVNLISRETALAFKMKNLPVLRKYCMGNEVTPIVCSLTNHLVDTLVYDDSIPFNIWEQHHFKVVNRTSIQKEGSDPGEILRSTDFTVPSKRSLAALEDMMRTIFLSPTAHKIVHNRWNNSDITNYENHQLPWALRNESNWIEFTTHLQSFGYDEFPSYANWMESLVLTADDLGDKYVIDSSHL